MASGDIVFQSNTLFFQSKTDTQGSWQITGSNSDNSSYDHIVDFFLSVKQNVTTGDCPLSVDNSSYTIKIIQN